MDFELHPFRQAGGRSKAGKSHGLFRIHCAAGIGEQQVPIRIDELEDIGVWVALTTQVGTAQGHSDDLRATGSEGVAHGFMGRKLPRAKKQAGVEGAAGDGESGHGRDFRFRISDWKRARSQKRRGP